MKWLQNNLPGVILASACAALVLIGLLLALLGTRPVSSGADASAGAVEIETAQASRPAELDALGQYRVITDRPLFNETRRPVIEIEEEEEPEPEVAQVEVADAPKVSLTGVVITPEVKLVSLTPAGGGEPVVFREGLPMQGEYNGWAVAEISPRAVVLESRNGQKLELGLVVHDQKIKEPPRPVKPAPARDEADEDDDGDPEQLSRAEEIRQRIAERREQLRQEAAEKDAAQSEPDISPYQAAIRGLMNSSDKEKEKDDDQ